MEVRWTIFLIIAGSALVTFLPRVLPLMVLSRMQLPKWVIRWLKHVPVAVMAALLAQALLLSNGHFTITGANTLNLLAAIPALAIAIFTRSLMGTVVAGVVSMMVLRFLI